MVAETQEMRWANPAGIPAIVTTAAYFCASCDRPRRPSDLVAFYSVGRSMQARYVCRPTLKYQHGEPTPGECFRRAVCWIGHHRIAAMPRLLANEPARGVAR